MAYREYLAPRHCQGLSPHIGLHALGIIHAPLGFYPFVMRVQPNRRSDSDACDQCIPVVERYNYYFRPPRFFVWYVVLETFLVLQNSNQVKRHIWRAICFGDGSYILTNTREVKC